jgi:hypothetical protein
MIKKFALAAALAFAATSAGAVTVTFEELPGDTALPSPLISGGLVFSNPGDPDAPGQDAFFIIADGSNGTTTLAPNFFGSTTTISAVGGAAFTLTSFDFSDAFDFADDPVVVTLNFMGGGNQTLTFTADDEFGMQTANVGISGILSFNLTTSGSAFGEDTVQLDNIVYSLDATGPAVPEPASWAMMIGGFGLVGGAMRRAKVSNVAYAA